MPPVGLFFPPETGGKRPKNRDGKRGRDRGNTLVDVHSAGFGRANSSTVWHRSTPVGARFCRLRETERPGENEPERERDSARGRKDAGADKGIGDGWRVERMVGWRRRASLPQPLLDEARRV